MTIFNTNMSKLAKISLVSGLVVSATLAVSIMHSANVNAFDCSQPRTVLTANILSTGEFGGGALAIVTNISDCAFNVGLDDYLTSNNQRFDSQGTVVGPYQSVELHINVPDCQYRLELTTDLTVLDSATVRSNICGATPPSTPPAPNPVPPTTPTAPGCTVGTISVTVVGPQNAAYYITRPNGTTFGWNGSQTFTNQTVGFYSLRADTLPGYGAPILSGTSGTLTACGNLSATITYIPLPSTPTPPSAPTPVPNPVPVPTYIPTPYPTYTPTPLVIPTPNPVAINFNAPCSVNATNSCNTTNTTNSNNTSTTTTTTNNTSTISQNGNGNVAGVNQLGAVNPYSNAGGYNPTASQLTLPTGNPYQYNIGIVNPAPVLIPAPIQYPVYTPAPVYVSYPVTYPVTTVSGLSIQKFGKNISRGDIGNFTSITARAGDTIEFDIIVTAPTNSNLTNVFVSDALPNGLTYSVRSTSLNNVQAQDGITAGGINIGSISAGQSATIKFFAIVNGGLALNTQLVNTATARADNVNPITSQPVYITIGNNSVLAGALGVRTGPTGDAFALASFGGLISSALYVVKRKGLSLIKFV